MESQPAIIIPAYQAEQPLLALVQALRPDFKHIIVIDDGSSEQSNAVFQAIEQYPEVTLLRHAVNLGKGQALKTGFQYVLNQLPECASVITADADGQHLPENIKAVALAASHHPSDLILGSRQFAGKIPLRSKLGNVITRYVFACLIGKKISDTQTGLRAIPSTFLPTLLKISSQGYEFELEMLIKAVSSHVAITEHPIATVYHGKNESSHFNPLWDSLKIYFAFIRFSALGLITAFVDLLGFILCFALTQNIFISELFARGSGGVFSFGFGKAWVFKSKGNVLPEFVKFASLWFSLLLLSYGSIYTLVEIVGVNVYLSKIVIQTLLFVASFSVQRLFVFRHTPAGAEA